MVASRSKSITAAALTLALATAAIAGQGGVQDGVGANFFHTSSPCPTRDFPTFEAIAPIPSIIDPFEQDLIPVFCSIQVVKNGNPVQNVRGNFESELVVRDNNTGNLEVFPLDSGRFKTDSDGFADFDFEIPAPIFADGFESGDVSAWSYTRSDFTKKKKANSANIVCASGSSTSGSQ